MLKVAAYARVSTDKEDQINSLTNQREYFESYIKSKDDWEFVKVYLRGYHRHSNQETKRF